MVLCTHAMGITWRQLPFRGRLSLLLAISLCLVTPTLTAAQGRADAERLTQDLKALGAQNAKADAASRRALARELADLARERQALLATLIETDPDAVLANTLSADDVAALPASVQPLVEQETQIDGSLEVLYEDRHDGSELKVFLNTGSERLRLRSARRLPQLQTQSRVRVRGVKMNGVLALSGATSVETLALSTSNTFGTQKTLVLLVNFQNDPANMPGTISAVQNMVFNVSNAWDLENSFQQTWLTGDTFGWFTIAQDNTGCDYNTIATLARQAATNAGVNVSAYQRYVYAFPNNNNCAWWGLGTVGGSPSHAWINGTIALQVVAHEMGHNFGLYHSHSLDCGATVIGPPCTSGNYGDPIDIMGGASGHFNAFQKERLGWLNYGVSPPITSVTSSGTYTIEPYASAAVGVKALKILKSASPQTWYYVEYRTAIGADSFLSASFFNMRNGVVLHTGSSSSGDTSFFLDATPGTTTFQDGALVVGTSFTDPAAGVTITPLSVSASGAVVSIAFGAPPSCTRQNPTLTLAPAGGSSVSPGTPVVFNASVTNHDSSGCGTSAFTLQANAPAGWTTSLSATSLTIAPTASGAATLTVTSSSTAAAGTYSVGLTTTNSVAPAYTGSASSTYTVVTPCSFSVAPTSQSLSAAAGSGSVAVTTTAGCAWSTTSNATWITVLSGSSGTTSGTARYSVVQNPASSARIGTLTVATRIVTVTQAGSAGGGPITFGDNFNRPDSIALGNGWSEATGDLQIKTNELTNLSTTGYEIGLAPLNGAIVSGAADFAWTQHQGTPRFGIVLRYQNAQNYYLAYRQAGGSSVLRISKFVNGVETILKTATLANPAKDVFFRIDASANGQTLTLSLNGVVKVTVTDSTYVSGGVGLLMGSTSSHSHRADNFAATAQ